MLRPASSKTTHSEVCRPSPPGALAARRPIRHGTGIVPQLDELLGGRRILMFQSFFRY